MSCGFWFGKDKGTQFVFSHPRSQHPPPGAVGRATAARAPIPAATRSAAARSPIRTAYTSAHCAAAPPLRSYSGLGSSRQPHLDDRFGRRVPGRRTRRIDSPQAPLAIGKRARCNFFSRRLLLLWSAAKAICTAIDRAGASRPDPFLRSIRRAKAFGNRRCLSRLPFGHLSSRTASPPDAFGRHKSNNDS